MLIRDLAPKEQPQRISRRFLVKLRLRHGCSCNSCSRRIARPWVRSGESRHGLRCQAWAHQGRRKLWPTKLAEVLLALAEQGISLYGGLRGARIALPAPSSQPSPCPPSPHAADSSGQRELRGLGGLSGVPHASSLSSLDFKPRDHRRPTSAATGPCAGLQHRVHHRRPLEFLQALLILKTF